VLFVVLHPVVSIRGGQDMLPSAIGTYLDFVPSEIEDLDVERLAIRTTDQRHHLLKVVEQIFHPLITLHIHISIPNHVTIRGKQALVEPQIIEHVSPSVSCEMGTSVEYFMLILNVQANSRRIGLILSIRWGMRQFNTVRG